MYIVTNREFLVVIEMNRFIVLKCLLNGAGISSVHWLEILYTKICSLRNAATKLGFYQWSRFC